METAAVLKTAGPKGPSRFDFGVGDYRLFKRKLKKYGRRKLKLFRFCNKSKNKVAATNYFFKRKWFIDA